jgi:hypothetical protein
MQKTSRNTSSLTRHVEAHCLYPEYFMQARSQASDWTTIVRLPPARMANTARATLISQKKSLERCDTC